MKRTFAITIAVVFIVAALVTLPGIALFLVGMALPTPARGTDHSAVSFDLAPDGKSIVFGAADGNLHELDLATAQVRSLTQTEGWEQSPSYSPDQRWIVYASCDRGAAATHICLRSRDGRTVRELTGDANCCDDCPAFSPDGSQVVFARAHRNRPYSMGGWTWDDWDVYVVNPDGSGLRRVTTEKHYQLRWPRFTADGKRIYYSTIGGRQPYVSRVVDLTGKPQAGPLERSNSPNGGTGAWASDARQSFDGQSFVFISDRLRPFSYDVMLGDSKGINVTSLGIAQRGSTYNNNPVLSPDNKRILFLASDAEKIASQDIRSLWEVRSDGSSPRQIADAQLFTNPRTWKGRTKGKP